MIRLSEWNFNNTDVSKAFWDIVRDQNADFHPDDRDRLISDHHNKKCNIQIIGGELVQIDAKSVWIPTTITHADDEMRPRYIED